jgi:hypothetical protein
MGLGYMKGGLVHDIVDIMSILWVVRHERNEKIRPIANGPKINDLAFIPNTKKKKKNSKDHLEIEFTFLIPFAPHVTLRF